MADDELEKLRQKVEKDPASRLFLPLAEEYRKAGKLDEAITVLLSGLEQHPAYTSARVAMGRIYLEKEMLPEAQAEFEKVVSVVPDNLFAHKKLAEIYREREETDRALSSYRTVLMLNPLDEDAKACIDSLSGFGAHQEPEESFAPETEAVSTVEEAVPLQDEAEDLMDEGLPRDSAVDEIADIAEREESAHEEAFPLDGEDVEDDFEEFTRSFSEDVAAVPLAETTEDVSPEPPPVRSQEAFEDVTREMSREDDVQTRSPLIDFSEADTSIARGDYAKALEVYRTILRESPENMHVLQRISELKAFLKMIGRGDEVVVAKLGDLLGGIRRRFGRG
ncbi:MAG TPA: tetratricopeptide repeat protein [Thermodesulfovibrionales bacterium]|nr:tetratricopeptide repeat protein [Thermodesulfovibrionales bacterium]